MISGRSSVYTRIHNDVSVKFMFDFPAFDTGMLAAAALSETERAPRGIRQSRHLFVIIVSKLPLLQQAIKVKFFVTFNGAKRWGTVLE